jgi:predicted polyphosphate/ATP-dependent NAD kinase
MPEPRDECRRVTLPSGETIRLRSTQAPTGEALAALEEVVTAAKRMAASMPVDDGAEALWARIETVRLRDGLTLREIGRQAGVRFSVLFRIGQGRMPDADDSASIGRWLTDATQTPGKE